jgi:hypothetical protein
MCVKIFRHLGHFVTVNFRPQKQIRIDLFPLIRGKILPLSFVRRRSPVIGFVRIGHAEKFRPAKIFGSKPGAPMLSVESKEDIFEHYLYTNTVSN